MKQLYSLASRVCVTLLLLLGLAPAAQGQSGQRLTAISINSSSPFGMLLNKGWKWQAGDNPDWARPGFDDSKWESIDPTKDIMDLPQIQDGRMSWMRVRLTIDSALLPNSIALLIRQVVASQIYVDGRLLEQFGKLDPNQTKGSYVRWQPVGLPRSGTEVVIAVRFALQKDLPYNRYGNLTNYCFMALVVPVRNLVLHAMIREQIMSTVIKTGAFFLLFILHLAYFVFFPPQKANLYFSGMSLFYALHTFMWSVLLLGSPTLNLSLVMYSGIVRVVVYSAAYMLLLVALYSVFDFKKDVIFWLTLSSNLLLVVVYFFTYHSGVFISEFGTTIVTTLASLSITMKAIRTKKPNATLIFRGLICSTIGIGLNYILLYLDTEMLFYSFRFILDFIGVISIPICISWFLGRDFAHMNRNLFTKLKEVEQLSAEKQQLLAQQKETLERQVAERTRALNQSIADLQAAQAQLIQKEKMASLGELTAGIAHEIQNPLNFVNNFAEVSIELAEELEESVQSGNQESVCVLATDLRTNMDYIVQNGQRASSIVRAMLEHSRSSTGERQPTDLNALAEEYLRLAYHGFRAKNPDFQVQLHTDFEPGLACLQLVAQDMGRVLLNLYNNAFYAVSEKQQLQKTVVAGDFAEGETGYQPQVWVCTRQVNGYVEVRVKDNGVGIPENIRDKVFQPFFTTKPTGQGTGLGLSLSYEVVTKGHGGEMTVESQAGQFTEFSICLPLNR